MSPDPVRSEGFQPAFQGASRTFPGVADNENVFQRVVSPVITGALLASRNYFYMDGQRQSDSMTGGSTYDQRLC